MGKRYLGLIWVLLFLIGLLLVLLFVNYSKQSQYVCSDGRIVTDKVLCTAPVLTPEMELSVCSGMPATKLSQYLYSYSSYALEDSCLLGLAIKHKDSYFCKKSGRDIRTICFALVAEAKNNPNECSQAELEQDNCYLQYAKDKKNSAICNNITDAVSKDSCYYAIAQTGDVAACDKMSNNYQKDSCYYYAASRTYDLLYCNKIVSNTQKQQCLKIGQRYNSSVYY